MSIELNEVWTIVGANIGLAILTIGSTITLFLWARSEANADRRDAALDRRENQAILKSIADEMKDFHGKLCTIEERNKAKVCEK